MPINAAIILDSSSVFSTRILLHTEYLYSTYYSKNRIRCTDRASDIFEIPPSLL